MVGCFDSGPSHETVPYPNDPYCSKVLLVLRLLAHTGQLFSHLLALFGNLAFFLAQEPSARRHARLVSKSHLHQLVDKL